MANWLGIVNGLIKLVSALLANVGQQQKQQAGKAIKEDPRRAVHDHFAGVMPEPDATSDLPAESTADQAVGYRAGDPDR